MPRSLFQPSFAALAVAALCATACHAGRAREVPFPAREAARYEALVSVHWVKHLLDHQAGFRRTRPQTYRNERFVVLEVGFGTLEEATEYRAGHLPGAGYFDTDEFETGYPVWRLREPRELQRAIGQAGIDSATTVVLCGRELIAAARVWWVMKYAGVADVRLMDGGVAAWEAAGYPLEPELVLPEPVEFEATVREHWLATTRYVQEHLGSPRVWLADVRSGAEFTGRTSGYDYLDACGRIPAALAVGDGDDEARVYVQADGRLRRPQEILAMWRSQGLTTASGTRFEREVVFYCGGGWRSSVAFFYAWLLGFENIRNYSDGWSAWSTDYQRDESATGSTPGWSQVPSGNPLEAGP